MKTAATRLVLFDLDGTLIDSQAGIFASLNYAFAQIGAALPAPEVLRGWIGPPFHQTFPSVLGDDPARVEAAIAHYRDHYVQTGWAGHTVYDGIDDAIGMLRRHGTQLAVVTTKLLPQARKIVANLPFGRHFARIYGPDGKTAHSAKAEMIDAALRDFAVAPAHATMIGDRHFDIDGARANGVRSIGVTWGFGSIDELRRAGAHAIVHAPRALLALLV